MGLDVPAGRTARITSAGTGSPPRARYLRPQAPAHPYPFAGMPTHRSLAHRLPYVRSSALITLICAHSGRRLQAQLAAQNEASS